ncbi:hypothetical protein GSI_03364 [Ganoderma sinense ZZ0214-1]|uniref:Uncharacterized protein n=1 Tax=Ganoderma sinense ZZ0214-1 TaxID=1077348 RepID=A0A2G8SLD7_9APHY|nr:hypothetical protein GSI_03364 [Ganoderma sinense ZZ0214-1]
MLPSSVPSSKTMRPDSLHVLAPTLAPSSRLTAKRNGSSNLSWTVVDAGAGGNTFVRPHGWFTRDHFESFSETIASSSYLAIGSLVKIIHCDLKQLIRIGDVVQAPLPMHVVRRFVNLKSLTVVADSIVPFRPSFVGFLKYFSVCDTLDSLYIRRGCYFIAFEHLAGLGAVLSFRHIKSLQTRQSIWFSRGSMNWSDYPGFTRLSNVKLCLSVDMDSLYSLLSSTVEHLSVWEVERPGMHETYHAWEVARLKSLKSLELTFAQEDIHWVVRTLVNNGSRVLETVSFNYLSIDVDQTPETVQHQLTEQVIDGILRASRPFASVTRVVVKLFANDPSNEGERWSKAVQAALCRTHELKMLHFSVHQYTAADWDRDW